ncbi:MAG: hypothetical protein ABIZ80_06950, partial [Bryobacteraceae bacterium]
MSVSRGWLLVGLTLIASANAADEKRAAVLAPVVAPSELELESLMQLRSLRRVFVDRLTGGETAAQMRELIISSLQNAKLFVITENQDRADATLRGTAEDLVFVDVHQSSESINARANVGSGKQSSRSKSAYAGFGVGENESSRVQERRHEAIAAVRLVN